MNRLEFLTRLRNTLEHGGLPQNDIDDALTYYEEVFLDAGFGKDEETSQSLGSPEEIAKGILADSGIHPDGDAEFLPEKPEQGAQGFENSSTANNSYGNDTYDGAQGSYSYDANKQGSTYSNSGGMSTAAKVIIIILTFPLWIGIAAALFGLTVALIATAFALIAAFAASGIALIVYGMAMLIKVPPVGLCMLGTGFILTGIFGLILRPAFKGLSKYVFGGAKKLVSWIRDHFNR